MSINPYTLKIIADCQLLFNIIKADQSLFNGNTGIMLLFIHYARFIGNHYHEDFARELSNDVCIYLSVDLPLIFLGGICVKGWSIEYMKKQGFVEGDIDEIHKKVMVCDLRCTSDSSFDYGLEAKQFNDFCFLIMPKVMTRGDYRFSAKYHEELKRKNMDGSVFSFTPGSAEYASYVLKKVRVENMLLPLDMSKIDVFSYFQRELVHASHSTMKGMAEVIQMRGASGISLWVIWGMLSYNLKEYSATFK